MIKRQDIIYEKIRELSWEALERCEEPGFTAQEIAEILKLDRGNVSKELNQLAGMGRLKKYEGRPVRFGDVEVCERWKDKETEENKTNVEAQPFQNVIGQEGSLKRQIQQVKAAILYPPNGLHTLLNGPTGTGKTMFARQMFEYAQQMRTLKPDGKYVVFNCAEYAENAQLLVSQIFGHKKGAFTGADRDKPGLVEYADGGVLFLDEIHRLPPEGQEMLFGLMDYGKYRRLGETEKNRTAQVLIIGATTEDLEDSLLKTFIRRMPVIVKLPSLEERPLLERLELIEMFLRHEQRKLNVSMKVAKEVILGLLLYECKGNIGQLQGDIQLLCARAFWEFKVSGNTALEINRRLLPLNIEQGYYKAAEMKSSLVEFLINGENEYIFSTDMEENIALPGVVEKKFMIFHKFYTDNQDQESGIQDYILSIVEKRRECENWSAFKKDNLNKIITGHVYYAIEEALEFAEMKLKRKFSDNTKMGFALHINALVEGVEKGRNIRKDQLKRIVEEHPVEVKVAKLILRILEDELEIRINDSELGYIAMFLCADDQRKKQREIGTIVIAHGNNTATSIAEAANSLLGTNHCKAINMPLDQEIESVYKKAVQLVKEVNDGYGVLLLVDMGSLNMFAERIEEETGIEVKSVGMVSTMMVLEALRKCTVGEECLSEVVEHLEQMMISMVRSATGNRKTEKDLSEKTLLVTCMSGMGAARKIAELVKEIEEIEEDQGIKIFCVGVDGKDEDGKLYGGASENEIVAVVGTNNLKELNVPYISLEEVVTGTGIERLDKALKKTGVENVSEKKQHIIEERVLISAMKELLDFLDAEKIITLIMPGFYELISELNIRQCDEKIVRYTIHVACMIERLLKKEVLPYHELDSLKQKYNKAFEIIYKKLKILEESFQLLIPETEVAYIVELLVGEENI